MTKRSYGQITGRTDAEREAKLRKMERAFAKYIYGADHEAIAIRFFVQEGLLEIETVHYGCLMLRLDTSAESPRYVMISLFFLAIRAANVCSAVRTALSALYTSAPCGAVSSWLEPSIATIHKVVSAVGCMNSVSPGITSLITCVMRGHAYNMLKTEIYPFVFPKDMYVKLDVHGSPEGPLYAYLVIVYNHAGPEPKPNIYIVVSSVRNRSVLLNLLRQRFVTERFLYLDRKIVRPNDASACVGVVQRLGWCDESGDIKTGVLGYKSAQIPVVKLEKFYTDVGTMFEFV